MTLIDSAAAFDKRCDELRDGLKDLFHIVSIHTFSELAFSIGTPQTPVPDAEMQRFSLSLSYGPDLGDTRSGGRMGRFKKSTKIKKTKKNK